jgi:hypothetical protein
VVALGISLPTTARVMTNVSLAPEEQQFLGFIFEKNPVALDVQFKGRYASVSRISNYFQSLHLKDGSVIVDTFTGCVPDLMLVSPNEKIFVITNDRDFQQLLSDPLSFHVPYILIADPVGDETLQETAKTYPRLYQTGSGFAHVVHQFPAIGTCPQFKLFKVYGHPPPGANQG